MTKLSRLLIRRMDRVEFSGTETRADRRTASMIAAIAFSDILTVATNGCAFAPYHPILAAFSGSDSMLLNRCPFRHYLGVFSSVLLLAGCQSVQVERKTVSMASGLSDLQYGQVLDNVALIADEPNALPHFALVDTGHTLIQSTGQGSFGMVWNRITAAGRLFDRTLVGNVNPAVQTLQRQDQDEWDTTPQLLPIQAILMRGLYHKVLSGCPTPDEELVLRRFFFSPPPAPFDPQSASDLKKMRNYLALPTNNFPPGLIESLANYKPAYAAALQAIYESLGPGAIQVGCRGDVPKNACYIGRHGKTYAWVTPDNLHTLTNLTISILDVASTDFSAQTNQGSKQVSPKVFLPSLTLPH